MATLIDLCTVDDEYVRERPRWVVTLDDGTTVYQDDGRPGREDSAWQRLRSYCQESGRCIDEMWLQFRSNRVQVCNKIVDGYFFIRSVYGVWGEHSNDAYIAGYLENEVIHAIKWKVPELIPLEMQTRDPNVDKMSTIRRKKLTMP